LFNRWVKRVKKGKKGESVVRICTPFGELWGMYGFPMRFGVLLLIVISLWPACTMQAQGWNTPFDALGTRQGLPEGHVFQVLEDRIGFIWIASYEGLFRYDGLRMERMGLRPEDSLSISANRIRTLLEDAQGNIWVGTNRGLNRMDRHSGNFRVIPLHEDSLSAEAFPLVSLLCTDARQRLWIVSNNGVFRMDADNALPQELSLPTEEKPISMLTDALGQLWAVTGDRLLLWEESSERFTQPELAGPAREAGALRKLVRDPAGGLWVLGRQGIFRFDPVKRRLSRPIAYPSELIRPVRALTMAVDGRLWLGLEDGLAEWDPLTGHLSFHRPSPLHPERVTSGFVHSLDSDRHGNIWISHNLGINRYNPGLKQFHLWQPFPEEPYNHEENHVQRMIELPDGQLFFTTRRGVYRTRNLDGPLHRLSDIPYPYFVEDFLYLEQEDLLLLTYSHPGKGVFRYDAATGSLRRYPLDAHLDNLALWRILPDVSEPHCWWISTEAGICRYDRHTRDTTWFYPTGKAGEPGNIVRYFCQTNDGFLWMEANTVFSRLDPRTGRFEAHPAATRQTAGRPIFRIRDILKTSDGTLWITSENGLTRFEPQTGIYRYYGGSEGVRGGEIVYAIALDRQERVWFTTFNHIHRLDPHNDQISVYNHVHGVHTTFHRTANGRMRSGHLLFGGANGMIVFHPDSMRISRHVPPVVLRDLRINNHAPRLDHLPEHLRYLQLHHQENGFTFQFATLEYLPEPIHEYRYRLLGFDRNWLLSGVDNRITYTNIPPGHYTLEVMASNRDGHWPDVAQWTLPVYIVPPFWQMVWFRLLILLLLGGLILYLYNKVHQVRKLRQGIELAEQNARYKSKFLTNMSHEIRTPMNAIIGLNHLLLETPLDDKQREYALTIRDSSENLLWIINDILDQARIESGAYTFRPRNVALQTLVNQITRLFDFRAREKGLELDIRVDPAVPDYVFLDPIRLMQVWINLLGNALKFTDTGRIGLDIRTSSREDGHPLLTFTVADTGRGIPPDQLPRIFDSFTQLGDEGEEMISGTGLGLSITREILTRQGGEIRVESAPGQGSRFHCSLPYTEGEAPPDQQEKELIRLPEGLRVLLVEDTPFNQFLAMEFLKKYLPGVRVELAENGQVALEILETHVFDLILMDVKMPVLDGLSATRMIRRSYRREIREIPILGLTANAIPQQLDACRQAGMDDVVTKPLEARDFLQKIRDLTLKSQP
jgi:signal transduction histidine kinase/ligand-binding sensor domain-containing protein/ActR/RegA family two-component response regulator